MEKKYAPKDASLNRPSQSTKKKRPSKQERLLITFLTLGNTGLRGLECTNSNGIFTIFFGEPIRFWSSCLNSDVSTLQNTFGLDIHREPDPYYSMEGHTAPFKRYWIADRNTAYKAILMINSYRWKRKVSKLSSEQIESILSRFE